MCVCEGQREKQRVTCVAVAGEAQDLRAHRRVQHATCGAAGGSRRRKRRKRRLARAAAQVVPNATQTLAVPLLLPPLQRHLLASHGGGGAPALSACRRPCQWSGGPPRRKQSRAARATHSGPLVLRQGQRGRLPARPPAHRRVSPPPPRDGFLTHESKVATRKLSRARGLIHRKRACLGSRVSGEVSTRDSPHHTWTSNVVAHIVH